MVLPPRSSATMDKKTTLGRSLYRAKANTSYIRREAGTDEVSNHTTCSLYLHSLDFHQSRQPGHYLSRIDHGSQ